MSLLTPSQARQPVDTPSRRPGCTRGRAHSLSLYMHFPLAVYCLRPSLLLLPFIVSFFLHLPVIRASRSFPL